MVASFRALFRRRNGLALLAPFTLALPLVAAGQQTHLWSQSRFEEFEKGTPAGVAIGSDGTLRLGPAAQELLTTPSTFAWSVAADNSGIAYLGTGSPASVLRVAKDNKPFTLFETKDLAVQVVRLGPDGSLYAATVPSGKVFKLNPAATARQDESSATLVFDAATAPGSDDGKTRENGSRSHYIWDMTFDREGRLYIATGGPAAVYRVDPKTTGQKPEEFFKSDEQHIRSLAWDAKGNLIAGCDGSGLVYRIAPNGKGYVVFESPRREVTAVAVGTDGVLYATSVGDKSHNPLPPLPIQGIGTISFTVVQPGSLQAANTSTTLPEGSEIYALRDGQAPRKIWSGKDEIIYALCPYGKGVLALSGNRGRLFSIEPDGDYADVAHLAAQQALSITDAQGRLLVATGNTGKLYSLDPRAAAAAAHEYASDVLDAGALARFGRVEIEPGAHDYQLFTRTGNVEQPIRGWTGWEPLKEGAVGSPAGRFLQWKAVLAPGGALSGVGVNYLPVNAAPVVDDLVVVPGARLSAQVILTAEKTVAISFPSAAALSASFDSSANTPLQAQKDKSAVTVRWAAHDDNGDDLAFALYLRGDNERTWRLLKKDITDKAYSFDAALIPDGGYRLKVVASDAPAHTPGDALTDDRISDRFMIDTTPPIVNALQAAPAACSKAPCAVHVSWRAEDTISPLAHAEYSVDAGPWQFVAPTGGLSDSLREDYAIDLPAALFEEKPGEHLLTVRVYDRYENLGVAKTTFITAK